MKVKQIDLSSSMFLGKIKFKQLLKIHRLTERKESTIDPFDEKQIKTADTDEEFQRQLSQNKLNKLVKYLEFHFKNIKSNKEKSVGLFHTSLLLALDHDFDYEPKELNTKFFEKAYDTNLSSCFLNKDKNVLYIPANEKIALIVDGQHRFFGLKKFYEKLDNREDKTLVEDFEFITTFLIGLDFYELGKVFATVNFTQKPVNRSLYYDIFGSVPDTERNEIKLAHDLALHLNNNDESPIKTMIKMLGKGYGLFSQSFFVEKMFTHFNEKGVWRKIYDDYINYGEEYKKLPKFMKLYLRCIEEAFNVSWPVQVKREDKLVYSPFAYDYILCKTTGMGAMLKLIRDIYPIMKDLSDTNMKKEILKILNRITEKDAKNIFSSRGDYGEGGGEGLQNKLYRFLRSKLGLTN